MAWLFLENVLPQWQQKIALRAENSPRFSPTKKNHVGTPASHLAAPSHSPCIGGGLVDPDCFYQEFEN